MRKLILTVLATAAAVTISSGAHAATNGCDDPKTGFDNVYCFAKVFMDLDSQLNTNYQALMARLDPTQKQILREGQRQWIGQRNAQCYRNEDNSNTVDITCALATTRKRIQFLSDRLAECRATGCNIHKLGLAEED